MHGRAHLEAPFVQRVRSLQIEARSDRGCKREQGNSSISVACHVVWRGAHRRDHFGSRDRLFRLALSFALRARRAYRRCAAIGRGSATLTQISARRCGGMYA